MGGSWPVVRVSLSLPTSPLTIIPNQRTPQDKTRHLKHTLNAQFRMIHELCTFVLLNTRKESLVRATLTALHAYLSWVPVGYIFESNMVQLLLGLFPQAPFRNIALQCLTEVASLTMDESFDDRFQQFFKVFSQQLFLILPPGTNIEAAYAAGTDEQQQFVQNLALFFTSFLRVRAFFGGGWLVYLRWPC